MKSLLTWILIGVVVLVAWFALAAVVGFILGAVLRRRNAHVPVDPERPAPRTVDLEPRPGERCSNPDCPRCWIRR